MEVNESEWVPKAIGNVDKYLHRGGDCKGDEPQLLGGTNLLNTIGIAMGLEMKDPKDWSKSQMEAAIEGNLCYFFGKAREAVDVIANKIIDSCNGDNSNFITVLPIELYYQGKLYELPLFRAQRQRDSACRYIDNTGRTYDSVSDWYENSKLPPCQMIYPAGLKLSKRPGYDYSHVYRADTPSGRTGSKVARGLDVTAAVVGLTAGVGSIFATGGLAIPFVAAGIGSALWGTGRATVQLVDRGTHGESINPFTDSESRMLWLGVAANLVSFGAMGASMRLASLATRGKTISDAFRLVVNITNGTNLAVSTVAILNTTIYMIDHHEDLTPVDVLFHLASMAFWAKGVYQYKTAGTIIRDAQNTAFKQINAGLPPDQADEMQRIRTDLNNDQQLLRQYHEMAKTGISPAAFSEILIDAKRNGNIQLDGKGNLILEGGHSFSVPLLAALGSEGRVVLFDTLTNLSPEQSKSFKEFRNWVNDDVRLLVGIHKLSVQHNQNVDQVVRGVIQLWDRFTKFSLPLPPVEVIDNTLVIGRAPPLSLQNISQMSGQMTRFVGEHLSNVSGTTRNSWISLNRPTVPVLFELQAKGLFTVCPVSKIVSQGSAVVELNRNLQISIHTLNNINSADTSRILELVGGLPSSNTVTDLPKPIRELCVTKYRLRFECQREESVSWMKDQVKAAPQNRSNPARALLPLLEKQLESFNKDRLYTARNALDRLPYKGKVLEFTAFMEPKNISEMVAYCEFAMERMVVEGTSIEMQLKKGTLKLPHNAKKMVWKANKAAESVFASLESLRTEFQKQQEIASRNDMVGAESVGTNLSDSELVTAIKSKRMKFGSLTSAAYHLYKHPTDPPEVYVTRANQTIRFNPAGSSAVVTVTLTQDGDGRLICFNNATGSCVLLEKDGRVFLCTFTPKSPAAP